MKELKLALVGFGNVGKALVRLLETKRASLNRDFDINTKVVAIATGRHGIALDPIGINIEKAIDFCESGRSLDELSSSARPDSVMELIHTCGADVLFENSPVNHHSGQPAIDHVKAALQAGMHVITANKGPVALAYDELTRLAQKQGRRFLFESAVMDGAPIFSLFRGSLPAVELRGFFGILNSCTNLLIELMEQGKDFEDAVDYAQSIGIAETDPSADVDGWDAAIKVCVLCNVLLGASITPDQVNRTGIHTLTPQSIRAALQEGERWKLVCSARLTPDGLQTKVEPARVKSDSPLYSVGGTSSFVQFELDTLPGLGILENNPGPQTTAFGLLADLVNVYRGV